MRKELRTKFSDRQYMLEKDFELYYYRDQHPGEVKQHIHNYYEFYFFVEGAVGMEIENRTCPLKYGDVVLIPPGLKHRAVIFDQNLAYSRFIFWISSPFMDYFKEMSGDYMYMADFVRTEKIYVFHNDILSFNEIQTRIIRLLEEIHSERFGKSEKIRLCVGELLLYLSRKVYEERYGRSRNEENGLYDNLIDYIGEHLEEDLSLERLSDIFYVSKYHIAHLFKEKTGLPVHRYITKKRLSICGDAIKNQRKITEICLKMGFRDYSAFYRAFKKEYGMSPAEWKELGRNIPKRKTDRAAFEQHGQI